VPSDSPTRFIGGDLFRLPHLVEDGLVIGGQAYCRTLADAGTGRACEFDAEECLEYVSDFTVRQPQLRVQDGRGGLGIGTNLRRGGTKRIGSLEGMAALCALATTGAMTDVNAELAD
jgi:hypothetical protein